MGQEVLSILIVQDLAIIPMMIILSLLTGGAVSRGEIGLQIAGSFLALAFVLKVLKRETFRLPFGNRIRKDPELQVLATLAISFGIALLSGLFYLSTALGAFITGLFLASTKDTQWVQQNLQPFKVLFLALFFISIGMMIDLGFLFSEFGQVMALLVLVLFTNSFINALIFRWNGDSWKNSLYGGSLLAQIGEFSFILVAIGLQTGLIEEFGYQITIIVIALSLMLSPLWISFFSRFVDHSELVLATGKRIVCEIPKAKPIRKIADGSGQVIKTGIKSVDRLPKSALPSGARIPKPGSSKKRRYIYKKPKPARKSSS
ncbi:MAG: cation:proton antiporter [Candidatus Aenigmatarchaeota archaeon]